MIINDTDPCEDTRVLSEYQQWLNKVAANLILAAAQRLVLTQCRWPPNLNPLHHSFCRFLQPGDGALEIHRSWQEVGWTLIYNPPFWNQNQFWVAAGDAKCWLSVFSVKAKDCWCWWISSVALLQQHWKPFKAETSLLPLWLQRLLHVSLVTSGDLCSFLFSLVRSGDVLQFLWQSTF